LLFSILLNVSVDCHITYIHDFFSFNSDVMVRNVTIQTSLDAPLIDGIVPGKATNVFFTFLSLLKTDNILDPCSSVRTFFWMS
jgi:hypothetical protein